MLNFKQLILFAVQNLLAATAMDGSPVKKRVVERTVSADCRKLDIDGNDDCNSKVSPVSYGLCLFCFLYSSEYCDHVLLTGLLIVVLQ